MLPKYRLPNRSPAKVRVSFVRQRRTFFSLSRQDIDYRQHLSSCIHYSCWVTFATSSDGSLSFIFYRNTLTWFTLVPRRFQIAQYQSHERTAPSGGFKSCSKLMEGSLLLETHHIIYRSVTQ